MIITREQQEKMAYEYAKTHTHKEASSFIDGMLAMLKLIDKTMKKSK